MRLETSSGRWLCISRPDGEQRFLCLLTPYNKDNYRRSSGANYSSRKTLQLHESSLSSVNPMRPRTACMFNRVVIFHRRIRIRRHKCPCTYYPNTTAQFHLLLKGDLVFKLNPGPVTNSAVTTIVSRRCDNTTTHKKPKRTRNPMNLQLIPRSNINNKHSVSVPIDFCLLNTRSINNKALALKDYAVDHDLDIFAMTETWLSDNDASSVGEVCPTGYYFHHVPRKNSRGGGVGLLFKKRIKIKEQSQEKFKSFEYTDVTAKCSNGCTRIVIIYRPPPSKSNQLKSTVFFDEFSTLAEQLVVTPGNLLIIGDFNYHVDDNTKLDTIKFKRILESFNLC